MNAMWPPDKLVEKQSRSKPTTFKQFDVKCIICVDFNSIYINRFIIFKNCLSQRLELFFYVNLKLTSIQFVFGHDKNKLLNLLEQVKHSRCSSGYIKDPCYSKELDSLEECVYSEVAALISSNDWRPEFLLQLFKDLRLLSSCADPSMQAALSSIHTLATRTIQVRF